MPQTHESLIDGVIRFARSRDRTLIVEAAGALLLVRVGLWTLRYATVRRLIDRIGLDDNTASDECVTRIARMITSVGRRLPCRITCLVEALAAQAMLRRRGRESVVRFGVRARVERAATIEAHAWLEHDGTVILGRIDELPRYAVLTPVAVQEKGPASR